jgi:CheY-like chemotaxis protein
VHAADSLSFALDRLRYGVRAIYNGVEGVAVALEDAPDVVFLDLDMPNLDGFEVATRIRQALGPAVLLIAHTAWGDDATLRRCKEAGFDHHLLKPANLLDILSLADPEAWPDWNR